MKCGSLMKPVTVAAALLAPVLAQAESYTESYNGATCVPYPPLTPNAIPYNHWFWAQGVSAFCHFPVPNGWDASNLSYVLFLGNVPSGVAPMRVRLCVFSTGFTTSCGTERTLTSGGPINWVLPPSPMPPSVSGGYLSVNFGSGPVSALHQFHTAWYR